LTSTAGPKAATATRGSPSCRQPIGEQVLRRGIVRLIITGRERRAPASLSYASREVANALVDDPGDRLELAGYLAGRPAGPPCVRRWRPGKKLPGRIGLSWTPNATASTP